MFRLDAQYTCTSYQRCQCGKCVPMPTSRESVCCCEIDRVMMKKSENGAEIGCIVDCEGFEAVCLNLLVLQTAYFM